VNRLTSIPSAPPSFIHHFSETALHPLSRTFKLCLPLFLISLPTVAQAKERPLWPVPALSTFNGSSWGNLQLGRTTFKQVQASYETGKGAYESSTELTQPKNTPVRVDCLWNKVGDDEILGAITVRFTGNAPSRGEVQRLFDSKEKDTRDYYLRGRYEDWRVAAYASKGIAAFGMRDGDLETVPVLLLANPNSLSSIAQSLTEDYMPVEERYDPNANRPRVMEFGTIDVTLDDDLDLAESERWRTRDRIKDAEAGGAIRYYRNGDGSYRVTMEGSKKRGDGSVNVTVSISGEGPYGPLSASGSGSETWKWRTKDDSRHMKEQDKVVEAYRSALREARRQAENSFAKAMYEAGPPSLGSIREGQWAGLINAVRRSSSLGSNSILR
jgi:hypothetical protein